MSGSQMPQGKSKICLTFQKVNQQIMSISSEFIATILVISLKELSAISFLIVCVYTFICAPEL